MMNAGYGQGAGALESFLERDDAGFRELTLEDAELEEERRRARSSRDSVPPMRGRTAPRRPPPGRSGRGVQRAGRPGPVASGRRPTRRPPIGRPRRPGRRPIFRPHPVVRFPLVPFEAVPSDRIQWLQDCLNAVMGARLRITGFMNVATRSLLRSFQRRSGLPMTGFPDAVTMRALREACAGSTMPSQPDMEPAPGAEPSPAEEPAADAAADEPPPAAEEIGLQGETATERVLRTLPADLRVTWESAGSLHTAANGAPSTGGVYVILLPRGAQKQAYVGKAANLNRRLKEHLWCATHLGLALGGYRVKLARVPDADRRSRIERHINGQLIAKGRVTNRKIQELEQELELELWGGSRG